MDSRLRGNDNERETRGQALRGNDDERETRGRETRGTQLKDSIAVDYECRDVDYECRDPKYECRDADRTYRDAVALTGSYASYGYLGTT
jgi:hypothetical protein